MTKLSINNEAANRKPVERESKMDVSALMNMLDKNRTPDASNRAKKQTKTSRLAEMPTPANEAEKNELEKSVEKMRKTTSAAVVKAAPVTVREKALEPASSLPRETLEAIENAKKYTEAETAEDMVAEEVAAKSARRRKYQRAATEQPIGIEPDAVPADSAAAIDISTADAIKQEETPSLTVESHQRSSKKTLVTLSMLLMGCALFFGLLYTIDKQTREWADRSPEKVRQVQVEAPLRLPQPSNLPEFSNAANANGKESPQEVPEARIEPAAGNWQPLQHPARPMNPPAEPKAKQVPQHPPAAAALPAREKPTGRQDGLMDILTRP